MTHPKTHGSCALVVRHQGAQEFRAPEGAFSWALDRTNAQETIDAYTDYKAGERTQCENCQCHNHSPQQALRMLEESCAGGAQPNHLEQMKRISMARPMRCEWLSRTVKSH